MAPGLPAVDQNSNVATCDLSLPPLTSLLMKADGVSEAYLDALIRRIAKRRGCPRAHPADFRRPDSTTGIS
jgi:hypothetical protein